MDYDNNLDAAALYLSKLSQKYISISQLVLKYQDHTNAQHRTRGKQKKWYTEHAHLSHCNPKHSNEITNLKMLDFG